MAHQGLALRLWATFGLLGWAGWLYYDMRKLREDPLFKERFPPVDDARETEEERKQRQQQQQQQQQRRVLSVRLSSGQAAE